MSLRGEGWSLLTSSRDAARKTNDLITWESSLKLGGSWVEAGAFVNELWLAHCLLPRKGHYCPPHKGHRCPQLNNVILKLTTTQFMNRLRLAKDCPVRQSAYWLVNVPFVNYPFLLLFSRAKLNSAHHLSDRYHVTIAETVPSTFSI